MNRVHMAVTPGLIEAARTGNRAAVGRALAHCRAWIASTGTLPPDLRKWLAEWVAGVETRP